MVDVALDMNLTLNGWKKIESELFHSHKTLSVLSYPNKLLELVNQDVLEHTIAHRMVRLCHELVLLDAQLGHESLIEWLQFNSILRLDVHLEQVFGKHAEVALITGQIVVY